MLDVRLSQPGPIPLEVTLHCAAGELLALMGMFKADRLYAMFALTGIILGAWYSLWLVQRTFFGKFREPIVEHAYHAASGAPTTAAAHSHGGEHGAGHGHGASHGGHDDHGHGGHGHAAPRGPVGDPSIGDLNVRELFAVVPLVACMCWIGLAPQYVLDRITPSLAPIEKRMQDTRQAAFEMRAKRVEVAAKRADAAGQDGSNVALVGGKQSQKE